MSNHKYAPDEIRISMFLPMVKKALMEGIEGRRQNLVIIRYSAPLMCVMTHGQNFFRGAELPLMKIFPPPKKKSLIRLGSKHEFLSIKKN